MKKIIILSGLVAIVLSLVIAAFAGDVPEALGYEDGAQIFIGTLKDFKNDNASGSRVWDVQVLPTRKIKGEVPINELQVYEFCYFGKTTPVKDKEYFFGCLADNSVWVYEMESYDEKYIKLLKSDEFAERIQNYLDEGLYASLEHERATIGQEISFAEFLYPKQIENSNVKKVTLRYQDYLHSVDVKDFEKTAKEITIVNAKNSVLRDAHKEDAYKTILYVELLDGNEQLVSYAAVSRFGEVDRYGLMMSRLMNKAYEMKIEDLQKLYSLFPEHIQKKIVTTEGIAAEPSEFPDENAKNYKLWLYGTAVAIFAIAFIMGFAVKKKR